MNRVETDLHVHVSLQLSDSKPKQSQQKSAKEWSTLKWSRRCWFPSSRRSWRKWRRSSSDSTSGEWLWLNQILWRTYTYTCPKLLPSCWPLSRIRTRGSWYSWGWWHFRSCTCLTSSAAMPGGWGGTWTASSPWGQSTQWWTPSQST